MRKRKKEKEKEELEDPMCAMSFLHRRRWTWFCCIVFYAWCLMIMILLWILNGLYLVRIQWIMTFQPIISVSLLSWCVDLRNGDIRGTSDMSAIRAATCDKDEAPLRTCRQLTWPDQYLRKQWFSSRDISPAQVWQLTVELISVKKLDRSCSSAPSMEILSATSVGA